MTTKRLSSSSAVERAAAWYFENIFGSIDGPGTTPFYCNRDVVGAFATDRDALARGDEAALFGLFVSFAMFQARRDVVIKAQQRAMDEKSARLLISASFLGTAVRESRCRALSSSAADFEKQCSVYKRRDRVDCSHARGGSCHVKDATRALNRMGDMGKLPTAAWLRFWRPGLAKVFAEASALPIAATERARVLVDRFATAYRVGRKLATMFVSALSTPSLAPGLTPWFPVVDGNELVVLDTNVARAIRILGGGRISGSYPAQEAWVRHHAARIDLRRFSRDVPSFSPRLVQQALYWFCSKSNRLARGDDCQLHDSRCDACAVNLCPFSARSSVRSRPTKGSSAGVVLDLPSQM